MALEARITKPIVIKDTRLEQAEFQLNVYEDVKTGQKVDKGGPSSLLGLYMTGLMTHTMVSICPRITYHDDIE